MIVRSDFQTRKVRLLVVMAALGILILATLLAIDNADSSQECLYCFYLLPY